MKNSNLNGIIKLDTPFAKKIGFTSDKFDGYLWLDNNRIMISFITSLQVDKGNFSKLLNNIWNMGFKVAVPTPSAKMRVILITKGFQRKDEWFEEAGAMCEVWEK